MKTTLTRKSLHFLFLTVLIFVSGCSKYQYVSIGSRLSQNEASEYVIENDTAMLKYSFGGENFPVTVQIFNKLLQPIYIDLQRSTIIIDNFQVDGSFYNAQSGFIAPRSYSTFTCGPLRYEFINLKTQDYAKNFLLVRDLGKVYSFNEGNTPIYFRSIIALTTNEDYSYPTFFDYSFWVSEIVQSQIKPSSIIYKQPNQFYFRKTTVFGNVILPLVILLSLAAFN